MDTRPQRRVVLRVLPSTLLSGLLCVTPATFTLVDELQDALCKAVDLALAVLKHPILVKVVIRLVAAAGTRVLGRRCGLGELANGGDENGRGANVGSQLRVLGLQQLNNCLFSVSAAFDNGEQAYPDGNVLEGGVRTAEEAHQVGVETAVRLVPHGVERCIVLRGCC